MHQRLQGGQGRAQTQLGELPTTHHLQQLHGELDFTNPTASQFHIVGTLGTPSAQSQRLSAYLLMQNPQRLKHVVVKVAAKHKRQNDVAQAFDRIHAGAGCHHPRFEPSQALPFTALHLKIFFQGFQRNHTVTRFTIWAQTQVHAKHQAVLGGLADQGVQLLDHFVEIAVVA